MVYDKDYLIFILSYISFIQNTKRRFKLYIWDGGLNKKQIEEINKIFPGVTIKKMIVKGITDKKFEKRYTAYINKPFMDVKYLRDKKFIGLDPDVIFYKEPKEIIDWIDNDTNINLYLSDCTNSYMNNYEKNFDVLVPKLNAGLLCLQPDTLPDLDVTYKFFNNKGTKNPDQTFYAYCLSHCSYTYASLDKYKYKIYISDNIRKDYKEYYKYLEDKNTICFHFINNNWKKFLNIEDRFAVMINPDTKLAGEVK